MFPVSDLQQFCLFPYTDFWVLYFIFNGFIHFLLKDLYHKGVLRFFSSASAMLEYTVFAVVGKLSYSGDIFAWLLLIIIFMLVLIT